MNSQRSIVLGVALATASLGACAPEQLPFAARPEAVVEQAVSAAVRRERAELIRDSAAAKGVTNGVLFAGIGQAETGLAHCDSEVGYGCPGPGSPTCGGAPILAGGADGPCSSEQGGLGMFQFDSGTYDQTLNTYGPEVLTIEGNAGFAVEFMIARIILSVHVDNVDTREEAIAFINSVEPGGTNWNAWLTSVTHYYNGCSPSGCSIFDSRFAGYRDSTLFVLDEFGEGFWDEAVIPEPPVCEAIPAEGRIIEENDDCATAGGPSQYWRTEQDGSAGRMHWTHTTDDTEAANFAEWKLDFATAGRYELAVYTDASFAESQQAAYVVTHAGGETEVLIDQTAIDGYQSLGAFDFAAGASANVRVGDNTGEPFSASDGVRLVFDALRVAPAVDEPIDEPDEPVDEPDEPIDEPDEPIDEPTDEPVDEQNGPTDDDRARVAFVPSTETNCASTPPGSLAGFAVALVALARVRRRRP